MSDIQPTGKEYFDNFLSYKYLLRELVVKGIKLKYRRSYLGIVWTLLEPLLTMTVLTLVFGTMLGAGSGEYPKQLYPIYILCGRLLFNCFSSASKIGMQSIRGNQALIKKVYIPKYLFPISSVIYNYIIFLISLIILFIVGFILGAPINWHIIEIIIPIIVLLILCVGSAMVLSTICVFFRDIEYLWEVIIMLLMYCSAIFYYIDRIKNDWVVFVIKLNPLYSIIENFRHVVLRGQSIFSSPLEIKYLLYSLGFSLILTLIGTLAFKKHQDNFILYI